jgi:hypothetical protein
MEMLGSHNNFFQQEMGVLFDKLEQVRLYLKIKGYSEVEIEIYEKAYNYFCINVFDFDGATILKDLEDLPNLDLDAMLHDYHYIAYHTATNFKYKWKADWIYFKGIERKGKDNIAGFFRFLFLKIIGIGFVPYSYIKRGKMSGLQKNNFNNNYNTLIK